MPILHLGVVDLPYVGNETRGARRARVKAGKAAKPPAVNVGVDLTGDVAEILEEKYHVMQHFYELHGQEIADLVANSMAGNLETMLMGGPHAEASFASAESGIDQMFRNFLSNKELDALGYPGIPTQAAKDGVNPRFKSGRGPKNRPSFIASGLYQSSFKTWVD